MLRAIKIISHLCFWISFGAITWQSTFTQSELVSNADLFAVFSINTLWAASLFYGAYFFLIRWFERRQFVRYVLLSVILVSIATCLFLSIHHIINNQYSFFNASFFFTTWAGSLFIAQCGSLIRGFINWLTQLKNQSERENRQLRTELQLLKNQINPHFLFNTLNNIDSLIHHSPERASESVIALSDLLRYMIYDTNTEKVALSKEFDCLKQYIALQQLRLQDAAQIRATFAQIGSEQIAPLLLLPFVENACKYADWNTSTVAVQVWCKTVDSGIVFECINTINKRKKLPADAHGIGLENVKRRLQLIYGNNQCLSIEERNDQFFVKLHLPIL